MSTLRIGLGVSKKYLNSHDTKISWLSLKNVLTNNSLVEANAFFDSDNKQ